MVKTRSKSASRIDEDRQRFLDEGAAAAQARELARVAAERAGGADAERLSPPPAESTGAERTNQRAASAEPLGAAAALPPIEPRFGDLPRPPRSPSQDTMMLWSKDLKKRLRRLSRPTPIPSRHPKTVTRDYTTSQPQVTPREASTPYAPTRSHSVRSCASTIVEARVSQIELEADERLAAIKKKELQLEADLIRKRLETQKLQIRAEGSTTDAVSDPDDVEPQKQRRILKWMDESQDKTRTEPVKSNKRLANEPPPDYDTPRRPTQAERHIRRRSPSREDRRRSLSPPDEPRTPHTARTQLTNEGTVAESMLQLFERMQMAARPAPKDIFELPHFYGDVSEWRSFYNTYTETSKRYKFTDYENVARLRMALRGDAKTCVSHVLSTATKPDMIMRILKKQFGRSEVLLDKAIEDLRRLPQLGPSANDLNTFAIKIMNIVSTIIDVDRRHYADNPMLIREVTDRLSPHLRSRWCDYAARHRDIDDPEILQLADFLMEESEQEMSFCHARAAPRRAQTPYAPPHARATGARLTASAPRYPTPATANASRYAIGPKVTYAARHVNVAKSTCLYCGGNHSTPDCRKLATQSIGARWEWAKLNRICYRCMDAKHLKIQCKAKACGVAGCPHVHHRLLHADPMQEPNEDTTMAVTLSAQRAVAPPRVTSSVEPAARAEPRPSEREDNDPRVYVSSTPNYNVLLKVLPVTVTGPKGTVQIFAFLDDGSTLSMIDQDVADEIGAVGEDEPLCIRGIRNLKHTSITQTVKATVRSARGGTAHGIVVKTVEGLGIRSQSLNKAELMKYEHLADLGDECYTGTGVPQMLIGGDFSHLITPMEIRQGGEDEPCAMKTPLGWAFFGRMPRIIRTVEQTVMHCRTDDEDLNEQVKKHWSIEALGVTQKENVSPSDQRAIDIFNATVRKTTRGRYEVGQLWASDEVKLPPSYVMARSRLHNLESRMRRDKDFAADYAAQIRKLLQKGYAERIMEPPQTDRTWFLPHFSVFNLNKGKGRAVFDCAAKSQGNSLNDYILAGPDLLQSLLGILLRFREWSFAVVADIQEMFLQIQIRAEDQQSQLFLWRGTRRDMEPQVYKLNRVCFGNVSSPFLAHSVRNRNAIDNADKYPEAVYDIQNNHYMDDYVASYKTENELLRTSSQVRDSHAEGNFHLRGYASNSERLLASIEPELHAQEPTHLGERQQTVLGMTWDPSTDTLGYNTKMLRVPEAVKTRERLPTKRELLSAIMSIYDPMGLIAQYVISAKIIFQRVWAKGTTWDAPLPNEEAEDFFQWLKALKFVATLRIPRQYESPSRVTRYTLHIFTDASTEAYCAVAYWRIENAEHEVQVSLAAGKSRVCPLKVLSVPRLELTAAIIGVRLADTIKNEQRYDIEKVSYWTDSQVLLGWIRDDARNYKPFVSHRLAEIAEKSDRQAWRYVPTDVNPADHATRGKPTRKIDIDDDWYKGPPFLRRPEAEWPSQNITEKPSEDLPEKKSNVKAETTLTTTISRPDPSSVLPDIRRFSNYDRLINSTAYVLLFVEKLKTRNRRLQLQVSHIKRAEHMWLQNSQRRSFPDEIRTLNAGRELEKKSRLYTLAPELSDDGVLRMKTRLGSAPVLYSSLHPVILDGRDPFTRLMVLRAHRRSAHIHNEAVINQLRQNYWILQLRPTVKAVARDCALCRLRRALPRAQPLGDLPPERLQAYQRPFTYTAQDYLGPMYVTIGRRREKRWVCLYTCLATRAIHLESVYSLSTDSALLALRRFAARRGWPSTMYSDNATCFKAASNELREAYRQWLPQLQTYGVQQRMNWKFIPPGNPSAGGAWERMVRTVKTAMLYTFNTRAPKPEVFETILTEIENIVNRRPLTHVNVDPDSEESLTPAHFLLLQNANLPMIGAYDENETRQWKAAQALADHFWRRWTKEYFPLLAPRKSSDDGGRQIQPGDVVIISEPNGPRSVWPKGVVEIVYHGPDGRVRSADIRTRHGTLRRPTCRLAVIASQPRHQESSTAGTKC
ncbi:uncharacterized protein LOC134742795 [Cydia strobilella]|uniref:uncharacterized protein LOC134742795 n=1 Tax=Cydia strobilella TaxID=1100964 RepID=UPI00300469D0